MRLAILTRWIASMIVVMGLVTASVHSVAAHTSPYYLTKGKLPNVGYGEMGGNFIRKRGVVYVTGYRYGRGVVIKYVNGSANIIAGSFAAWEPDLLKYITSIDVADDGTVYIADPLNHVVRARYVDGAIRTVAGNGLVSSVRQDGPDATQLPFNSPTSVKIGRDGLLYIMDEGVVRRVNADGSTTHVVGLFGATQQSHPFIDGGDADKQYFPTGLGSDSVQNNVHRMTFDSDNHLYVTTGTAIYKLEGDGTIHEFFHSNESGIPYTVEAVPFSEKKIINNQSGLVAGLDVDHDNNIWMSISNSAAAYNQDGSFAHTYSSVLYFKDGVVHTIAGGGNSVFDGTTPTYGHNAVLSGVGGVSVDDTGDVYFVSGGGPIFNPYQTQVGSYIGRLSISTDTTPPEITSVITPDRNNSDWNNTPTTISWNINDPESSITSKSGCDTTTVNWEVIGLVYTCVASSAGGTTSRSVTVKTDFSTPVFSAPTWTTNPKPTTGTTTLTVPATDNLSGIAKAEYFIGDTDPGRGNGATMTLANQQANGSGAITAADLTTTFGADFPTGVYKISVRAQDVAGNWSDPVSDYLVVYDTAGPKFTGKRTIIPSLGNNDNLPGLIATDQTDKAKFGFSVKYNNQGQISNNSDFQFTYNTGTHCKNPNRATNCHDLSLNATNIAWLTTEGTNNSTGIFQGTATMIIDGQTSTVLFRVTGIDGERLSPTANDQFQIQIFNQTDNPNTATPIYRVNSADIARGNIKIQ